MLFIVWQDNLKKGSIVGFACSKHSGPALAQSEGSLGKLTTQAGLNSWLGRYGLQQPCFKP